MAVVGASCSVTESGIQRKLPETMEFTPIGYIQSAFKFKNGTPRQPSVCQQAVAQLTVTTDVYNNPEHSLDGLEQFSHVWVIFVFHKNNNAYIKPKVKPPRLNGAKVGVFSTRSPYRLNPIGLTLAKVEGIQGATIHLSGIDMLDGTPVIDLKPYIPVYDQPKQQASPPLAGPSSNFQHHAKLAAPEPCLDTQVENADVCEGRNQIIEHSPTCTSVNALEQTTHEDINTFGKSDTLTGESHVDTCVNMEFRQVGDNTQTKPESQGDSSGDASCENGCNKSYIDLIGHLEISSDSSLHNEDPGAQAEPQPEQTSLMSGRPVDVEYAAWIREPPYKKLKVRFTPTAEDQLQRFSTSATDDRYQLQYLKSVSEAKKSISDILEADPRSSYRRKKCVDRLYFFMVDVLHVTCWFNDDDDIAEVLRIKANHEKMLQKLAGIR